MRPTKEPELTHRADDHRPLKGGRSLSELKQPMSGVNELQAKHGRLRTIDELQEDHEVIGSMPMLLVLRRRSDGAWFTVEGFPQPQLFADLRPSEASDDCPAD